LSTRSRITIVANDEPGKMSLNVAVSHAAQIREVTLLFVNGGDGNDVHGDRVSVTAGSQVQRLNRCHARVYVLRKIREGEVLTVDVPDVNKE
jgi:hypothetical protein